MFRIAPYRHRRGADSFMPRAFGDWFNWPEISWQGFNVDVKETAEGYTLQADLPGVSKEHITLSVDNGYLTIAVRQEELKSRIMKTISAAKDGKCPVNAVFMSVTLSPTMYTRTIVMEC